MNIVAVTVPHDIATVARLAREIWHDYYVPLIGQAQVDYMLEKFQSEHALAAQLASGYEYFLIDVDAAPAGYFAIQAEPAAQRALLSKLYVVKTMRGRGLASAALQFIESRCAARGMCRLWLAVYKQNPAVRAYERLGFKIVEPILTEIGGGYVMNDYRMEKTF